MGRVRESHLARGDQGGEALEAAIVGALHVFGEAAGGELPHVQVVAQALAADAVSFTARIGAGAGPRVARLLAFHGLGVVRPRCCVNSDQGPKRALRLPACGVDVGSARNGAFTVAQARTKRAARQVVARRSVVFRLCSACIPLVFR